MAYTAIDNPELYFQTKTYTGDGSTPSITLDGDEDMQPDFVWIKNRDEADGHCLFDSVRGVGDLLDSDTTALPTTDADTLTSFDSDGFALGADVKVNTDTEAYVAWCWKAGTTSGIATNVNTSTTPSPYSFNQTSGFSILQTTRSGAVEEKLVAHGLGAVPHFWLWKKISGNVSSWYVYHHKNTAAPETDYLLLDVTNATADSVDPWNDTVPNSVNIGVGQSGGVNDANNFITYAWTSKQGFSKFGSYTGNGDADGTFVYTGFRPAFVMLKSTTSTIDHWVILDSVRSSYNLVDNTLAANLSAAETADNAYDRVDFVSNGFKLRGTGGGTNHADVYIYMAFAEAPFVNSGGVPANAR